MAEVFDFGLQQHKIKMDGKFFENNLFAVAGDTGRRLEVQLLDSNNMVQDTTGISLRLNAIVAGQSTYAQATLTDATKGLYDLDLPNGMLIAPGNWQFQWQIIGSGGEKLHSFAFTGSIGSNLSEGGTQGKNFYLNLEDLKAMQADLVNGTIDSSILETNITEKLTNLETQYAPRLTEVTAQLAQIVQLKPTGGDDTALIQNAIDSMDKGTIYLQKGGLFLVEGKHSPWTNSARLVDGIVLKSGITIEGNGATIRADINCTHIFTQALRRSITDPANNPTDITIRNLKLEKPESYVFTEQSHLINIESATNVLIENCSFTGWTGDAICFGFTTNTGLSFWFQSYIRNVRVLNCDFDGVNKGNRQAISLMCGEDVLIENCRFTRCTRPDMPGAIDVEPEYDWAIVRNIKINNCEFYDVGGAVGVVTYALSYETIVKPQDLFITNCYFTNNKNNFDIAVRGVPSEDGTTVSDMSVYNVVISNNNLVNGRRPFIITGCEKVSFKNNEIMDYTSASLLGEFLKSKFYVLKDFVFKKNILSNCIVEGTVYDTPIAFNANIYNSVFSENTFIDCGNTANGVPKSMAVIGLGSNAVDSSNLVFKNNEFINTKFSANSYAFHCSNVLTNAKTILLRENDFMNMTKIQPYSMYKQCLVSGFDGIVADSQSMQTVDLGFNLSGIFDETTLPDSFGPSFQISSLPTGALLINIKSRTRKDQRHWNVQMKFEQGATTKLLTRHPLSTSNGWGAWVTFTGV